MVRLSFKLRYGLLLEFNVLQFRVDSIGSEGGTGERKTIYTTVPVKFSSSGRLTLCLDSEKE